MSSSRSATTTISTIVTGLMRSGAMFTTFDVFRLAQDAGIQTGPYGTTKPTIEAEIASQSTIFDSYTRTLASWLGANGLQPWIYHPGQSDPSTYTPKSTQAARQTGQVTVTVDNTPFDDDEMTPLAEYPLEELLAEIAFRFGKAFSRTTDKGF
jgi:hypothetical protein